MLSYADQRSDYTIPERYLLTIGESSDTKVSVTSNVLSLNNILTNLKVPSEALTPCDASIKTLVRDSGITSATLEKIDEELRDVKEKEKDLEAASIEVPTPATIVDPFLVDWDGPNDQDNPK